MPNNYLSGIEAKRIMQGAVAFYGKDSQHLKTMEEAAEVIQAVAKLSFASTDENLEKNIDHLMEELADMQVMIDQMRIMYPAGAIDDWYAIKLRKLQEKIKIDQQEAKELDLIGGNEYKELT